MDCKYYHDDCETDRDNCILCVNSSKYKKAKVRKYGIEWVLKQRLLIIKL